MALLALRGNPCSVRLGGEDKFLGFFEIALVFVCLDLVACFIINTDHSVMCPVVELRVAYCVVDCIRPGVPKATEWQRIRD